MDDNTKFPHHLYDFELSHFLLDDHQFNNEWLEEPAASFFPIPQNPLVASGTSCSFNHKAAAPLTDDKAGGSSSAASGNETMIKNEIQDKVAFKTRSEIEILEDGFKWRKYGKKMVKNSSNPRNYYKCCVEGCMVKKRVERDNKDPNFVITTYQGIHNHQAPLL